MLLFVYQDNLIFENYDIPTSSPKNNANPNDYLMSTVLLLIENISWITEAHGFDIWGNYGEKNS